MRVVAVPNLKDNYAYLVIDEASGHCAVVDPGEAGPIEAAIAREQVSLAAIWATHHHLDHTGGIAELIARHPGIEVIIGQADAGRVSGVTRALGDGDSCTLGQHVGFVIHNPGHTRGAISYMIEGCVFTGDTLFGAGCGRLFEGDAATMHASLQKLAALPPDTRVYFGHEYTASNLRFAAAVEPDNRAIAERRAALPTSSTPSTIALELATNPFLRTEQEPVIQAARARGGLGADAPATVFAHLRAWKDDFVATA